MSSIKRILITPGEPTGIGPDIYIKAAQQSFPAELIAIADPLLLHERANALGIACKISICDLDAPRELHIPGVLKVLPIQLIETVEAGVLNPRNSAYVIKTLDQAAELCLQSLADAIVTGPVHKGVINDAGIAFTGHTEFFADYCKVKNTVMLFVVDELKVALATTHLPLSRVPDAITPDKLYSVLEILHQGLKDIFGIPQPHILVAGLNPHAGEGGHLGREEIDVIEPLILRCQKEGMNVTGPLPADTLFTPKYLREADAALAMYHDQALPLVKYLGFGGAVNVTLGLPFLRASVDHGTALDIAGTGQADIGSLFAAISFAISKGSSSGSSK